VDGQDHRRFPRLPENLPELPELKKPNGTRMNADKHG
jgi:hypothetical protein